MKLFNKYQSRALQFVLDLLAQLQSTALSTSQIQALAQQWGLDYADQVIQPLLLLCKQAAKIFQTICKKETALKRVLRDLLSAVSFAQI